MGSQSIILFILLLLGVIGKNNVVTYASIGLLFIRLFGLSRYLPYLADHGLFIGITILTAAVFTPLASGEISTPHILSAVQNFRGITAITIGALVAYLGGRGVELLKVEPQVVTGIVIGTVLGAALLKGVPVGPVIAAGIASLVLKLLKQ